MLLINILISTARKIIKFIPLHFDNFKPTGSEVYQFYSGETNIMLNYSADRMMLSYTLTMGTYQVHMHHILQF